MARGEWLLGLRYLYPGKWPVAEFD